MHFEASGQPGMVEDTRHMVSKCSLHIGHPRGSPAGSATTGLRYTSSASSSSSRTAMMDDARIIILYRSWHQESGAFSVHVIEGVYAAAPTLAPRWRPRWQPRWRTHPARLLCSAPTLTQPCNPFYIMSTNMHICTAALCLLLLLCSSAAVQGKTYWWYSVCPGGDYAR